MLRIFSSVCFLFYVSAFPRNYWIDTRNVYMTAQNIEAAGYRAETHHVTTSDGYILEMHRIPFARHEEEATASRPAVLLMHGLMSASDAFIALGPEYSIAYNFADAGFDVWLGNARGNKNSRRHVSLNPDDDVERMQFFDYSWEEVGMYDIAAMVDYIVEQTGRRQIHYVGHSQGGTVFLVLNSMRPEYNSKFASAHLLAGVGYMEHFPNEDLAYMAQITDYIYAVALAMGLIEMFPPHPRGDDVTASGYNMLHHCLGSVNSRMFCEAIGVRNFMRLDLDTIFENSDYIGGGSLKLVAHYGQNIRDELFQRYHYGLSQNQALYGSTSPPLYDLSLITVDTVMHYTVSDDLLDERDVLTMVEDIPNAVARRVARDTFLHGDFTAAMDTKELVTDFMIESILSVEEQIDSKEEPDNSNDDETDDTNDSNDDSNNANDEDSDIVDENVSTDDPNDDSASNMALSFIFKIYFVIYSINFMLK